MMYSVIDFETTGLSPYYSEVIEFAAVRVAADPATGELTAGDTFASLCAPRMTEITPVITRITGITAGMTEGFAPFEGRLAEFLGFLGDSTVVAHNIPFDMGFLRRYCKGAGIEPPNKTLCTLVLSRRLCRSLPNHRLETVAAHLGVSGEGYHRALADAVTTAKVLIKLLGEGTC
jgi:DNA polymerase III epsilon subunit-like protein